MSGLPRAAVWVLDEVLRAWFAPECLVCGDFVDRNPVCGVCSRWEEVTEPWCLRCGRKTAQPVQVCGGCTEFPFAQARSRLWFHGPAREVLHEVKFSGRSAWLEIFRDLCRWPGKPPFLFPTVVPVPLHRSRLWERGFNQSFHLARWFSECHGLPLAAEGLEKFRETCPQSGLSRERRLKNAEGAFRWRGHEVPEQVLLIDDVWTTGSTLGACAAALRRAGTKEIFAWTLFRTPLR